MMLITPPIASEPYKRRTRSLDDLDAFHEIRGDILDGGGVRGARIHRHAVDQHQRVVAFGAPDEHRGELSGPAVARHLDPSVKPQQARHVGRLAAFDFVATDHGDRHERLVTGDGCSGDRDDDRRQVDRVVGYRCGKGASQAANATSSEIVRINIFSPCACTPACEQPSIVAGWQKGEGTWVRSDRPPRIRRLFAWAGLRADE